jgi:hypothetical protein
VPHLSSRDIRNQSIRTTVRDECNLVGITVKAFVIFERHILIYVIIVPKYTRLRTIDYTSEDGLFPVSASCVTISNLDLLSSNETGVDPGIGS